MLEDKIESLIKIMTIEEKVGQMNQYGGFDAITGPDAEKERSFEKKYHDIKNGLVGSMLNVKGVKNVKYFQKIAVEESRLGIPLFFGFDIIHGYKTLSPIPLAEAASWDLEAIRKSTRVAAIESASSGINFAFSPMVDVSRDPRWGRVMEGSGEDPFLGSKIAEARIKGFQGDDLSAIDTVAACVKHFAAYGFSESGKDYNKVDIGLSTLHNIVMPPFKAAVDVGVCSIMNSFNELNGVPATGDKYLLRDILKEKWKFKGFVLSDWASINEMISWGYAKDKESAAKLAVLAGCDVDMEGNVYIKELSQLVKKGIISESLIDDAVRRILKVKLDLGLFEDPYRYCDLEREKKMVSCPDFSKEVLSMAKKSIVLLKNSNNILPLKKKGLKIALIGALANDKNSPLGSWRLASDNNTAVSILEGMTLYEGNELIFAKGCDYFTQEPNFLDEVKLNSDCTYNFNEEIEAAKKSDVVILVLGEHGFQSGEGRSKSNIQLSEIQQKQMEALFNVNPNIVLVLNNGRPLAINWANDNIPAIVEAWHLGSQSGNAVAEVLYGDYNPSGKLPMTFPRNVGQVPIYYNHKNTGRPINSDNNVFWSHYNDVENTPLFHFGHGLSYTTFEYSKLKLEKSSFKIDDEICIKVDVSNVGNRDGREVVQFYIRDLVGSITRPVKELKGFQIIDLKPKETKTVHFTINKELLGFYDNSGDYVVEVGDFECYIGGSSKTDVQGCFSLI